MNKDELDNLKKVASGLQLPVIGSALKTTLDATKMSPALQTWNVAFHQSLTSPAWIEMAKIISDSSRQLALLGKANQPGINSFIESLRHSSLTLDKTLLQIGKQWEQSWGSMGQALNRAYEVRLESYPNLAPQIEALAKQGWFVSMYFGLDEFDQVASETPSADSSALEEFLEKTYRDAIEEHANSIIQEYPEREFAIAPALSAHLRGEYALSVPVFFAQADGICSSTVGKHLFHGKPGAESHITSLAADQVAHIEEAGDGAMLDVLEIMRVALWMPMAEQQPIAYNPAKRDEHGYLGLNRHTVVHGESLDYATEINSLKAFSLLSYVASLLSSKSIHSCETTTGTMADNQ